MCVCVCVCVCGVCVCVCVCVRGERERERGERERERERERVFINFSRKSNFRIFVWISQDLCMLSSLNLLTSSININKMNKINK